MWIYFFLQSLSIIFLFYDYYIVNYFFICIFFLFDFVYQRFGSKIVGQNGGKRSTRKKVLVDRRTMPIHRVVAVNQYHQKNWGEKSVRGDKKSFWKHWRDNNESSLPRWLNIIFIYYNLLFYSSSFALLFLF